MNLKFYKCPKCNNIIIKLAGDKGKISCCNAEISEVIPNSVDASVEKHVPLALVTLNEGVKIVAVDVGAIPHPMTEEHYISHIIVETNKGFYVRNLKPFDNPSANFAMPQDEHCENVYSICNLHGIWSAK